MSRPMVLRALAVTAACLMLGSVALAQGKKPETETVQGKIKSVTMKGKAATLKVETDAGDEMDILVTPKMHFSVAATGEKEMIKPGVWVSCDNMFQNDANKLYFAKEFVVHLGAPVPAKLQRNASNGFDAAGQVGAVADDSVLLKPNTKIMFDEGFTVAVRTNDASLAEEGDAVEIEGIKRGEKFLAQRVAVTSDKTLTAEDVFGAKGKSRKPAAKASKTAAGKGDGDTPKGEAVGKPADPFGAKKKPEGEAAAKVSDPFSKNKPESAPAAKAADPFKDKPKEK